MKLRGWERMVPWARRLFCVSVALLVVASAMWITGAIVLNGWSDRQAIASAWDFWSTYAKLMDVVINLGLVAMASAAVVQFVQSKR